MMANQAELGTVLCEECGHGIDPEAGSICDDCARDRRIKASKHRERWEAARAAGIKHCGTHPITIMLSDGNMRAVSFGKVLFEMDVMGVSEGHDIFAYFLKTWFDAGIEGC